ncbi:archaeosortase family protein ArtE [Methanococcus maripaludis]|uniref:archaeosortase family protein ArtE n=1 Tax=Methanococcus maripaludis TaxID=39152 RepID=UPI0015EC9AB5|nr:archaeosortase family protein ArtE [Methanococcus maripaludis]
MNKKFNEYFLIILKYFSYSYIIYHILCHFESNLADILTYQSYLLLKLLLNDVVLIQNLVYIPNIIISITEPCTGMILISILLAYILTVENRLKYYVFGSLFCILLIYLGNIFRIVIIGILANTFGNGEYIHNTIGFVFFPTIAVFTILLWSKIRKRL